MGIHLILQLTMTQKIYAFRDHSIGIGTLVTENIRRDKVCGLCRGKSTARETQVLAAAASVARTTVAAALAGCRVAEPATVVASQPLETLLLLWMVWLGCS